MIDKFPEEYEKMVPDLTDEQKRVLREGPTVAKPMEFGVMYSDWKRRKGLD
tara:strand:- start:967 stop:1119 length:153 start_codon:yes stop_codon:yes gene_type:complete